MLLQENMTCRDCPYVKDEFEARKAYLEKCDEYGDFDSSCFCDKLGGKLGWWGYCEDAEFIQESEPIFSDLDIPIEKIKHRNRRKNAMKHKRKLRFQARNSSGYPSPSYAVDKYGNYTDDEDEIVYYKPTYKSKHSCRYSFHKRAANKSIRRLLCLDDDYDECANSALGRGKSAYKKKYEYAWSVY